MIAQTSLRSHEGLINTSVLAHLYPEMTQRLKHSSSENTPLRHRKKHLPQKHSTNSFLLCRHSTSLDTHRNLEAELCQASTHYQPFSALQLLFDNKFPSELLNHMSALRTPHPHSKNKPPSSRARKLWTRSRDNAAACRFAVRLRTGIRRPSSSSCPW